MSAERLQALVEQVGQRELDALLISDIVNVRFGQHVASDALLDAVAELTRP